MDTFLLQHYFELNVHFTYTNNLGVLDLLVCASLRLTVKRIMLSARQSPLVATEPNLISFVSLSSIY